MRKNYYPNIKPLSSFISPVQPTPTEEQAHILREAKNGKPMVIRAFAGAGKTATGSMIGHEVVGKGYFMVFSRAARRDASSKMPANIEVMTGHSLAYRELIRGKVDFEQKLQWTHEHGRGDIPAWFIARELGIKTSGISGVSAGQLTTAVRLTLQEWLISDVKEISDSLIPDKAIPATLRMDQDSPVMEDFKELIVHWVKQVWNRMATESDPFPITHDGYLKLLHLSETQLASKIWLLDEYQDTTPVQDAIFQAQEGQKIYIGDPYQQIFGWRGAIDAMARPLSQGVSCLPLSESFRFNETIAGVANVLLKAQGEQVLIKGQKAPFKHLNYNQRHTVLVRNNVNMMGVIVESAQRRQPVYIPGGIQADALLKVRSALSLHAGKMDDVAIQGMRALGSWQGLRDFASTQDYANSEYRDLVNLVERYHKEIPAAIEWAQRDWDKIASAASRITLITAHKAKGRQWGYVKLCNDLALSDDIIQKLNLGIPLAMQEQESVNLLYVAITRAQHGIALASKIRKNLADLNTTQAVLPDMRSHAGTMDDQEAVRQRTQAFIAKHLKRNSR